jgi:lysophospholipase L1-like esterase
MAKKVININGSATQMTDDINSNFNELYQGAGGGGSSIDGLPTRRVKVYDVMTRSGQGVGAPTLVSCSIKAGTKYIIEKSQRGTNWSFEIISTYSNGSVVQEMLRTQGGTTSKGGYNVEIEATADADSFGITAYSEGYVNIYHYENVPTLGAARWLGKKWLVLGDSITTEHDQFAEYGYSELVAKSLGMQRENMAVGGVVSNYFYNKIDNYSNDYDLITIMLGTNDQGYSCAIGALNDSVYQGGDPTPNSSFIARLQLFYEKLRLKYPKSVIAFITPIKRSQGVSNGYSTNGLGLTTEPYAQAVKSVCDYYSIPCIDIFNAIDPRTETARTNFFLSSSDGTHPNALGHELLIAPIVEARLREIAPFYFND